MSFQTPLTIKDTVENIRTKKYLLPSIQRELVWSTDRIERLFDSLLSGYPIGSFLFWEVSKEKSKEYQFYEFVREYHERDKKHSQKADIGEGSGFTAVLDGQQRLTALNIGLSGYYAEKLPRKHRKSSSAFPEKKLYLNLLKSSDAEDMKYGFQFLSENQSKRRDENNLWFKVEDILNMDVYDTTKYLARNHLNGEKLEFAGRILCDLHKVIHVTPVINYYLEKDQDLEKVLQIFIRINSAGVPLDYAAILLSTATAQWKNMNARDEITRFVDEICEIGSGFKFNQSLILKACLVLADFKEIAFKVKNYNKEKMLKIEEEWRDISEAIRLAVTLVARLGYNQRTLIAHYALIPIAYYLLKKGLPLNFAESVKYADDRKMIQQWLIMSLLKRTFGGQPDNVLRPTRDIISKSHASFPLNELVEKFKGETKSLVFDTDNIKKLLSYEYGESYTFSTLALLYPTLDFSNQFHIDHIFPKSLFQKTKLLQKGIEQSKIETYLDIFNDLPNLQLLEGIPNQEKLDTDFKEWLHKTYPSETERKDYMAKNYIPDVDLSLNNFDIFISEREKLLKDRYQKILML